MLKEPRPLLIVAANILEDPECEEAKRYSTPEDRAKMAQDLRLLSGDISYLQATMPEKTWRVVSSRTRRTLTRDDDFDAMSDQFLGT